MPHPQPTLQPARSSQPRRATPPYRVVAAQPHHAPHMYDVIQRAHAQATDPERRARFSSHVQAQLQRFPDGQWVALARDPRAQHGERVIACAMSMRTNHTPSDEPRTWRAMVGDHSLPHHNPHGAWLYGVELAVLPEFQGCGIGSALYAARFAFIKQQRLQGWYAGGMLMGYQRVLQWMTPLAYARAVVAGTLADPTVSMQLRRGMHAHAIIEGYDHEPLAGDCAVLLSWCPSTASRTLHSACHWTPPRPPHRAPFHV